MTTQENGSLGLTKKSILKRLDTLIELNQKIYDDKIAVVTDDVTAVDLKSGLTDGQVVFVKTTITGLISRIVTLETKATAAALKFVNIEARLKILEGK